MERRSANKVRVRNAVSLPKALGLPLDIVAARYAESVEVMDGDFVLEAPKAFAKRNPGFL